MESSAVYICVYISQYSVVQLVEIDGENTMTNGSREFEEDVSEHRDDELHDIVD